MNLETMRGHLLIMVEDVCGKTLKKKYANFLLNNGQTFISTYVPELLHASGQEIFTDELKEFLPEGCIMIERVYLNDKRLKPTTMNLMDSKGFDWQNGTGEEGDEKYYYINQRGKISAYPFVKGTLKVHYNPIPGDLASDSGSPDYDEAIHELIVLAAFKTWCNMNDEGKRAVTAGLELLSRAKQYAKIKNKQRDKVIISDPDFIKRKS